jgi:hypothetical protein
MSIIEWIFGFAPQGNVAPQAIILIAVVTVITGLGLGYLHKNYDGRD